MSQKLRFNETGTLGAGRHVSYTQCQEPETSAKNMDQAYQAADNAAKRLIDIQAERAEQTGDDNVMGMRQKGYDGDVTMRMNDAKQRGNNNVIGLDTS